HPLACRRRVLLLLIPDSLDATLPFAAAGRLRATKVIAASPRMGIDHAKRRGLAAKVDEDARQDGVLVHVGEIAGMESVPIVHPPARSPHRAGFSLRAPAASPVRRAGNFVA